MRMASYRDKLKRMKNHVSCLQSRANQLLREQGAVQQQLDVFEGLLCARTAWGRVVESILCDGSWEEAHELLQLAQQGADMELQALLNELPRHPEHVVEQMPLLAALSRIDRTMHEAITQLTPSSAAQQWVSFTSDTMQLLLLHELDQAAAGPLLTAHMTHVTAWLLSLYYFNTHVALELHNVNLLTRQKEPPPAGHWVAALQAAGISPQQQHQIAIANRFVAPRLHKLQQEQLQLLQQLEELQQCGVSGPELSDGAAAAGGMTQQGDSATGETTTTPLACVAQPGSPALPAIITQLPTATSSVATDAATTAAGNATRSGGSSGSSGSGDCSNRLRQQQSARASELMHKMSANHRAWVVVASMRGHYSTSVLEPLQLAKLIAASAPYLLIGAPIYDSIGAGSPPPAATPDSHDSPGSS